MPKFVDEGEIALATHFVDLETEDLKYYAGTEDRGFEADLPQAFGFS